MPLHRIRSSSPTEPRSRHTRQRSCCDVSSFWDGTCSCDTLTLTALKRPKLLFPVLITPRQQQAVIVGLGFQLPILPVSLAKMPIRSDIKLRSWVLIVPG